MTKAPTTPAKKIIIDGKTISRCMVIHHLKMMEQQKERVDALLLAIKDQQERDTFSFILADLAKSLQEDHAHWYELQNIFGIRADLAAEADDE